MNHAVNVRVFLEDLIETSFLGDVDVVERWPLPADELNAVDHLLESIVKIVRNHNFVVCLKQGKSGERTNVAAATVAELVQRHATEWCSCVRTR